MSAKLDKTLITARDVKDYLWELLWKDRQIENDFDFGYDRALNDVMYGLMYASREPECRTCAECAVESQTLITVEEVLDYLIDVRQENCPPKNEYERGYERAINALVYQVWLASPEWTKSRFAPREIPKSCSEGVKVINLANARRDLQAEAPKANPTAS
jgi:hypothetical protein